MKTTPLFAFELLTTSVIIEQTNDWKPLLIQVVILILFQILKYLKYLNDQKNPSLKNEPKIKTILDTIKNLKRK